MALATGQDVYNLTRCLYEFPDVFEAYRLKVIRRLREGTGAESFASRRERTRAQRIANLRRRRK